MNPSLLLVFSCFLFGAYAALMAYLIKNIKTKEALNEYGSSNLDLSLLVPFNQPQELNTFLESLKHINLEGLGQLKVILIDDREEKTQFNPAEVHPQIQLTYQTNEGNQGKKSALIQGLKKAQTKWIMTTDADCLIGPDYFQSLNSHLQNKQADLFAAPVLAMSSNSFQGMNLFSLSAFSYGSSNPQLLMASGANLVYKKVDFETLEPYSDNMDIPSGDDMFLIKAFKKAGKKSNYLAEPSLVLRTQTKASIWGFLKQQHRWVAKTHALKSRKLSMIAFLVFLTNAWLIALIFFQLGGIRIDAATFWLLKIALDFVFIRAYQAKLQESICIRRFLINSIFYPFFAVALALSSFVPSKKWS